jgi:hypothetical protein
MIEKKKSLQGERGRTTFLAEFTDHPKSRRPENLRVDLWGFSQDLWRLILPDPRSTPRILYAKRSPHPALSTRIFLVEDSANAAVPQDVRNIDAGIYHSADRPSRCQEFGSTVPSNTWLPYDGHPASHALRLAWRECGHAEFDPFGLGSADKDKQPQAGWRWARGH